MLGLAVVILLLTFAISSERDLGSGLLPDRPGRGHASPLLAGPTTLVFRLERTSMIAWFIGLAVYGTSMGTLFNTIGDMMNNSPMIAKIIGPAAAASAGPDNDPAICSFDERDDGYRCQCARDSHHAEVK